jgi:hypothetical protein
MLRTITLAADITVTYYSLVMLIAQLLVAVLAWSVLLCFVAVLVNVATTVSQCFTTMSWLMQQYSVCLHSHV